MSIHLSLLQVALINRTFRHSLQNASAHGLAEVCLVDLLDSLWYLITGTLRRNGEQYFCKGLSLGLVSSHHGNVEGDAWNFVGNIDFGATVDDRLDVSV